MPEELEQNESVRPGFFVYVVESPSSVDLYHGRSEGSIVAQAIALDGIPAVARTAVSPEAFVAALRIGLPEAMKQFPEHFPVLHLSAHGSTAGIQLSSDDVVTWNELRELLIPINESLDGALLLSMSACQGYSACQMAMQFEADRHPYVAMVGNYGTPTWSDTAVSYMSFYHLLANGASIHAAVEGMKAASGNDMWVIESAEQSRQGFLDYVKQVELGPAQQDLRDLASREDLSPNAKAFEREADG